MQLSNLKKISIQNSLSKNINLRKISEIQFNIKDDSIEIGSDYYHKYGGIGWKCLNDLAILRLVEQ